MDAPESKSTSAKEDKPAEKSGNQGETTEGDGKSGIKVILLGDSGVGKSKLIERFLMDKYVPLQNSTYALTIFRHKAKVGEKEVDIDFYDTAGQERFASMHPSYYFRAQSCVLVFDTTRKITYKNLMQWYKELKQYRPGIPIICVANKIDVNPKATTKKFKFATSRDVRKSRSSSYIICSSGLCNPVLIFSYRSTTALLRTGQMWSDCLKRQSVLL